MSAISQSEHIKTSVDQQVLCIHIDRPARKNALTHAMYSALTQALESAKEDKKIKAILIRGNDDCFTAGNDMEDFLQNPPKDQNSPVMVFLNCLANVKKPLVAAVNGPAVGVGTTLLLHCDLVYAGPKALFKVPFVSLGLCPEAGSSYLLPKLMGHPRAAQLLMLGESIRSEQALQFGLINDVSEDFQAVALSKSQTLAALPAASVQLTKQLMREHEQNLTRSIMDREGTLFVERLQSPEAREAVGAFLQKRRPDFKQFD